MVPNTGTSGSSSGSNLYPSTFRVFATSGSVYAGSENSVPLELAPSPTGRTGTAGEPIDLCRRSVGDGEHTTNSASADF